MTRFLLVASFITFAFVSPALADEGHRDGKHHGPPPAAFDACKGKADGDACTFEGRRGTVNGTCRPARRVEALVCRGPHHRH